MTKYLLSSLLFYIILINGRQFTNVTSVVVFAFSGGPTTSMHIVSKNDSVITVSFDDTQVYQGLAGLFDNRGATSKFGWNPLIINNVTSVPTSGGIITVHGWYISPSAVSNNTLTFTNETLSLKEIGIGGKNLSQSYYRLTPDQSTFVGIDLPVSILIREVGALSNFSFEQPIAKNVTTDNYMLHVSGDSFGSDIKMVFLVINLNTFQRLDAFTKHTDIIMNITKLYPVSVRNGNNSVFVNVTNFNISNTLNFTIYPVINSISNCSVEGGVITIGGNYLSLENVTKVSVKIGGSECKQPVNLNEGHRSIQCTIDHLPKGQDASQQFPVSITLDQFSSNDNGKPAVFFSYDRPASSSSKHIPNILLILVIQIVSLFLLYTVLNE
ncbi:5'-nucleotidase [Heterostelium album PN500]|uniref:5'-nucleotidase n=1 Tax=Heterostelium pallidum (strain ATCC 26659 / Pp 5 / PN500) TaxID=670386 RepID=D3BGH0_HETP5|nr:5'-nucleotidase [Heterostelium album PN500]EFA79570.1 5'-nucleotidase [Heterostelium album PN500]|eukprot:XP_020431691.1 5'-nucleotidase [Heterostelium album PN500]